MRKIMHEIAGPYLLFLGDTNNPLAIKTSRGVREWRPELCLAEYGGPLTLGLPKMSPQEAAQAGAKAFVLGLANAGGIISPDWITAILDALDNGMDIINGLHQKISDIEVIRTAAEKNGRQLHDIRHRIGKLRVGTGVKREGNRILTVGTDCATGKMYTSLAIERDMKAKGFNVDFRATGQTGILVAGQGTPIDAVVADFISGAVEDLCPDNDPDHWDIIEGQGSLFNPAFAGVSLGLLHGAQADILVMCHEADRYHIKDTNQLYPIPDMGECIDTNLQMARLTSPNVRLGAISLNCRLIDPDDIDRRCQELEDKFNVPCFDPMVHGTNRFIDRLEQVFA